MSERKLTKAMLACLKEIDDPGARWYSIAGSGHRRGTTNALREAGLLEAAISVAGNDFYRITPAGRLALSQDGSPE